MDRSSLFGLFLCVVIAGGVALTVTSEKKVKTPPTQPAPTQPAKPKPEPKKPAPPCPH